MREDWDNLIILDGCRFDQFDRINKISGRLEARTSLGSATPEFLIKNFGSSVNEDTMYVTANPMYRICGIEDTFYKIVDVWKTNWDEQYDTVLPQDMMENVLKTFRAHPDKKLIAHFMQPHYLFIGDTIEHPEFNSGIKKTYKKAHEEEAQQDMNIWDHVKNGDISEGTVIKAYDENLKIVLKYVDKLVTGLSGKTIVTSDHGNHLGERPIPFRGALYGHPRNTYTEELRKVPWLIVNDDDGERRSINEGQATEVSPDESELVKKRLEDLGYTD
jgi:hypothetical protein